MTPTAGTTDPNLPHKPRLSSRDMCRWAKTNRHAAHYARRSYGQWHKESGSKHVVLLKENMRKVRVLLGVLAVLVFVGSATGCGLLSDQTKQEAKNKVESKAQQAKQEAKKKVESKARQAKKKIETKGQQAKQE